MLWDRGSWEPMEAARESYRSGRLKFRLSGHELRGQWMLVKTGSERGRIAGCSSRKRTMKPPGFEG